MRSLFLLFIIIFLSSCNPEPIEDFIAIPINQEGDVECIEFLNDQIAYVSGGQDFFHGFVGKTSNGGQTWELDSLTNKKMFALDVNPDKSGMAGIDGKYFDLINNTWDFQRTTEWGIIKDLIVLNDSTSITVGGHAYRNGFVNRIDKEFNASRLFSENIEFNSIIKITDQILLLGAYGSILRSTDQGENWVYTNGTGDFFKDLLYINDNHIFALGYNGLILKSEDQGISWKESKKLGDFQKSKRLASLAQVGPDEIWAVGKAGLVLVSTDLGNSWEERKMKTDADLRTIATNSERILIGGTDGFFVSIEK